MTYDPNAIREAAKQRRFIETQVRKRYGINRAQAYAILAAPAERRDAMGKAFVADLLAAVR